MGKDFEIWPNSYAASNLDSVPNPAKLTLAPAQGAAEWRETHAVLYWNDVRAEAYAAHVTAQKDARHAQLMHEYEQQADEIAKLTNKIERLERALDVCDRAIFGFTDDSPTLDEAKHQARAALGKEQG